MVNTSLFTQELLQEYFNIDTNLLTYNIRGENIHIYYTVNNIPQEKKLPFIEYITFIFNKLNKITHENKL